MKFSHYNAKEVFEALHKTRRIPRDMLYYQFLEQLYSGYCDKIAVAVNLKEANNSTLLAIADYLSWEKSDYDDVVYFDIERG